MIPTPLKQLEAWLSGSWLGFKSDMPIRRVSIDTRTAEPGDLYFAIKGLRLDGHAFLPQAAGAGCCAAVVKRGFSIPAETIDAFPGGVLAVDDPTAALAELARRQRERMDAAVIGVTGSNGKTTVKRMIHHVLGECLKGTASLKSFNNHIGLPLTILAARPGDDYVVCELGTSGPGEIGHLTEIARPHVAVITSVSETHLEKLESVEKVAAEKASILDGLTADGLGIVTADYPVLDAALAGRSEELVRFGQAEQADYRLTAYEPMGSGGRFCLNDGDWTVLQVPGRHMALNAIAAAAVAVRLGLPPELALERLATFTGVEMRLQRMQVGERTILNDAYNANPASMLAAADVLSGQTGGRKVFIAGDMRELGPREKEIHLRVGQDLAATGVDFLIGVGPLGRYIAEGAASAGLPAEARDSVESLMDSVTDLTRPGDIVLIKGSRGMKMERLIECLGGKC